jgi:hypothetical protein
MFSLKPFYITLVIRAVAMAMKGKAPNISNENDHPLVKANVKPAMVKAKAKTIVPIFSPSAFYIAKHSFPTLAESSDGLHESNHALSCLRIASTYAILIVLIILSAAIVRKA